MEGSRSLREVGAEEASKSRSSMEGSRTVREVRGELRRKSAFPSNNPRQPARDGVPPVADWPPLDRGPSDPSLEQPSLERNVPGGCSSCSCGSHPSFERSVQRTPALGRDGNGIGRLPRG